MSVIYMLITISIAVAIVFFVLFVLAVRKGQYDDSYTPSVRMLFDDELIKNPEEIKKRLQKNPILILINNHNLWRCNNFITTTKLLRSSSMQPYSGVL